MRILDLTAGNRAIWFDKENPLATFIDTRAEVNPTFVADAGSLPPEVGAGFDLVVFDPPHKNNGQTSGMTRSYGHSTALEIERLLRDGAAEAWRVTKAGALMAFKWNDHTRKLSSVLPMLSPYWIPLFGHGVRHQQSRSATSWSMLLRNENAEESHTEPP
jgi:hypothetical protein